MPKIKLFLTSLGLSEKEIAVYLAGLKFGPIRAALLSRKTGFTRQHTYDLLKSLEQKGLVAKLGKNYGQRFVMEAPENLKNVLERKKQKIEKLENSLVKLMPEFESFYNPKGIVPKIKFFEEIDGIKEIYEDMLRCRDKKHYYIGALKELIEAIGAEYLDNWIERRVKAEIFSKAIRIKEKELPDKLYSEENKFLREIRFAPKDIKFLQTIVIYDNKVAVISSQKECFGFLVESEEYSQTMRILFNALWDISAK